MSILNRLARLEVARSNGAAVYGPFAKQRAAAVVMVTAAWHGLHWRPPVSRVDINTTTLSDAEAFDAALEQLGKPSRLRRSMRGLMSTDDVCGSGAAQIAGLYAAIPRDWRRRLMHRALTKALGLSDSEATGGQGIHGSRPAALHCHCQLCADVVWPHERAPTTSNRLGQRKVIHSLEVASTTRPVASADVD